MLSSQYTTRTLIQFLREVIVNEPQTPDPSQIQGSITLDL